MRDTNRLMGALDSLETLDQLVSDQNLTAEPIKTNQIGLSVAASIFVSTEFSDIVASSTINSVTLTTNTAQLGDIISFTSGTLTGLQIKIKSVDGLVNTLVSDLPSLPAPGDTVDILRYRYPKVDSSGIIPISGDVVVSGAVTVSGTVTADIAGLTAFQTSQYTIGLTAIQITPTPLANRSSVSMKVVCNSNTIIYIGNSSAVTSSTGFPLFNGDSVQLDITGAQSIYAISNFASNTLFALEIA